MTEVHNFPWKFKKHKLWQRSLYIYIHRDKRSIYCPHSQGRKPLRLGPILILTLSLMWGQ